MKLYLSQLLSFQLLYLHILIYQTSFLGSNKFKLMARTAKPINPQTTSRQPPQLTEAQRLRQLDAKLAAIFRKERIRRQEMCIYVDSEEEQIKNTPQLSLQQQEISIEQPQPSLFFSSDEEPKQEEPYLYESPITPNLPTFRNPIFSAASFPQVEQIDFQLYTAFLARSKIYGSLLVDQFGSIIWCDKGSHQILEGSLNNFARIQLPSLFLFTLRDKFLQKMRSITEFAKNTTLKWIIYSKNSKRRYINVPLPSKPSNKDVFYRFLKCVSVRVRPISICLPSYRDPNGFCNQELVSNNREIKCFFVEMRHTKRLPKIEGINILDDPIIQKFMRTTKLKSMKGKGLSRWASNEGVGCKKQKKGRNRKRSSWKGSTEEIENGGNERIALSKVQGLGREGQESYVEAMK